jgi:hypothetical protein
MIAGVDGGINQVKMIRRDSKWLNMRGSALILGAALAIALVATQEAKADFVGVYAIGNFAVTNTDNGGQPSGTFGFASTSDDGVTVLFTGSESGSGLPGTTEWLIDAAAAGTVSFDWSFTTQDIPGFQSGGYLVNNVYTELSDGSGLSDTVTAITGNVTFTVTQGEQFGFEMDTLDNQFFSGLMTISDFSAPTASSTGAVPEPSMPALILLLAAATALVKWFRNRATLGNNSEQVTL